jgi:hypothetical protein
VLGLFAQILLRIFQSYVPAIFRRRPAQPRALLGAAHIYNRLLEPTFMNNEPFLGAYCGIRNVYLADQVDRSIPLARGFAFMSMIVGLTPLQSIARRWSNNAIDIAASLDSDETVIYCLNRTACYLIAVGDWKEAERRLLRAADIALRIGDRRQLEESTAERAVMLIVLGRFEEGLTASRELFASGSARDDAQITGWARNFMIQTLTRLGRPEEAIGMEAATRRWFAEGCDETERIWAQSSLALALLATGDLRRVKEKADEALALLRKQPPVQYYLATTLSQLCEIYCALAAQAGPGHQRDELLRSASTACDILKAFSKLVACARPMALLWRGVQLRLAGDARRASKVLRTAVSDAEAGLLPYFEAIARLHLAAELSGPEKESTLQRATALLERCGASEEAGRLMKTFGQGARG